MKFWARLKFLCGVLFVLLLVGLLVLYLNNAMSTVRANKAELGADTTNVGVDYPGQITTQNVTEGETVQKGQTLFVVNSPLLAGDLTSGVVSRSSLPFSVDPRTNAILVKAGDVGVVEKIYDQAGSYVPGGTVIATLDTAHSLYISGHFHLSPPDYARVKKGSVMRVTFPDNSKTTAAVYSISLASTGGRVDTVVKARLQQTSVGDFRFPVGTPVEASLRLTQRTWWQQLNHFINKLFKPSAA